MKIHTDLWPEEAEPEIDPSAVACLQTSGADFRLIDCREQDEWDLTRISGAELLPLSTFEAGHTGLLTDPADPVVIYCHHGMRSGKAARFLRQKGHRRVWSMAGGIEDWSLRVDPAVPRY